MNIEHVDRALNKLRGLLPLKERQEVLPQVIKQLHLQILDSLYKLGRPPTRTELMAHFGEGSIDLALARLNDDDLVVLNGKRKELVGAYPLTTEKTAHHLVMQGRGVNAMCAVDALSVSPMFGGEVEIESCCHVSKEPIYIRQHDREVLERLPGQGLTVGVRWQNFTSCAAHSLCLEMVFLKDQVIAQEWRSIDEENIDIFTIDEAIAFGAGFFKPLLE
jgi:mercuric reductase